MKFSKENLKSSNKLILEKFLDGEEASYFLIVDRKNFKFLAQPKIIKESKKKIRDLILVEWVLSHQLQLLTKF